MQLAALSLLLLLLAVGPLHLAAARKSQRRKAAAAAAVEASSESCQRHREGLGSVVLDTAAADCVRWSASRWSAEVSAMAAIGVDHVVLSPLICYQPDGSRVAYYNTSLQGARRLGDCAGPLLAAAQAAGGGKGKPFTVTLGQEKSGRC